MSNQERANPKPALVLALEALKSFPVTLENVFKPDEIQWLYKGEQPSNLYDWIETAPFDVKGELVCLNPFTFPARRAAGLHAYKPIKMLPGEILWRFASSCRDDPKMRVAEIKTPADAAGPIPQCDVLFVTTPLPVHLGRVKTKALLVLDNEDVAIDYLEISHIVLINCCRLKIDEAVVPQAKGLIFADYVDLKDAQMSDGLTLCTPQMSIINGKEDVGRSIDGYKTFYPDECHQAFKDAFSVLNMLRSKEGKLSGQLHPYGFNRLEYQEALTRLKKEQAARKAAAAQKAKQEAAVSQGTGGAAAKAAPATVSAAQTSRELTPDEIGIIRNLSHEELDKIYARLELAGPELSDMGREQKARQLLALCKSIAAAQLVPAVREALKDAARKDPA